MASGAVKTTAEYAMDKKTLLIFLICWFFFLLTNSLLVRTRIDKLSYGGKHFWSENEKVYTDIFSNISTLTTEYIYYFSPIKEWLWFLIWTCLNVQQCMPRPKIISLIFFFFFGSAGQGSPQIFKWRTN